MVTAVMKLKDAIPWKESYDQPRQHIKKHLWWIHVDVWQNQHSIAKQNKVTTTKKAAVQLLITLLILHPLAYVILMIPSNSGNASSSPSACGFLDVGSMEGDI